MSVINRRTYTVRYWHDADDLWYGNVNDIEGCHTQGKTLEEVQVRILEVLSVCGYELYSAHIVEIVED